VAYSDGTPPFRHSDHASTPPLLQRVRGAPPRPLHLNAHSTRHMSHSGSFFRAPKFRIQGAKARHPLPRPAGGVVILEPFRERPAGTQTHSRRTDRKLGRLHRARQALVRVPESSTKYGGKTRKPGGKDPLRCGQLSVSPQGFPSKKIFEMWARLSFSRCSQDNYLFPPRGCSEETHPQLPRGPGRHVGRSMASRRNRRHGAADSNGPAS
jgi:hypothetical protein